MFKPVTPVILMLLSYSPDYNVEFFRKFVLVMNALDNRGTVSSSLLTAHIFT